MTELTIKDILSSGDIDQIKEILPARDFLMRKALPVAVIDALTKNELLKSVELMQMHERREQISAMFGTKLGESS